MSTQRQQSSATPIMTTNEASGSVAAAISRYLVDNNVSPTQAWLQNFMYSIKVSTPIQALQKTALFRILASDIRTSLQQNAATCLPSNISDPNTKERSLRGPIIVQLIDIEDIGRSRWSQVEAIEAEERGETTRGREIIRVIPEETQGLEQATAASTGPHKLLLQDATGTQVYGLELKAIPGINFQMSIGTKLVLKDITTSRGLVLLEPRSVEVLGGKIDAWDKKWREERKSRLKQQAKMGEAD